MRGRIVIGEGEAMPMLYIGSWDLHLRGRQSYCNPDELIEIDIAVDPAKALTSSPMVKMVQWLCWLLLKRWFICSA